MIRASVLPGRRGQRGEGPRVAERAADADGELHRALLRLLAVGQRDVGVVRVGLEARDFRVVVGVAVESWNTVLSDPGTTVSVVRPARRICSVVPAATGSGNP